MNTILQSVPNLFPSSAGPSTGSVDHHLVVHPSSELQQHLRRLEDVANETSSSALPPYEPHHLPMPLANLTGLSSSGYLPAIAASELVNASVNYDLMTHGDMEQLSLEIEKERYQITWN